MGKTLLGGQYPITPERKSLSLPTPKVNHLPISVQQPGGGDAEVDRGGAGPDAGRGLQETRGRPHEIRLLRRHERRDRVSFLSRRAISTDVHCIAMSFRTPCMYSVHPSCVSDSYLTQ